MGHGGAGARIDEVAARQHGVVARGQLLEAGVSPGAIEHRLRTGSLRPVHRGIYRAGPIGGRRGREMAAVLACGPGAVLSHRTAAALWGLMPPPQPEAPVEIAGPRTLRGPASGVRLHRRAAIPADEVTRRGALPLTTPARTLLDLASGLGPYALERALARGIARERLSRDAMETLLRRYPGRRGTGALRALLHSAADPALTRSEAEARFLALLRKGRVPRPRVNAVVHGLEVDFFWPDQQVVAEVDGFAYHSRRNAFENDRRRDAILAAAGLSVLRFTWSQIHREPEPLLVRLSMALGARTPRPGDPSIR